jgi:hypothetical protein
VECAILFGICILTGQLIRVGPWAQVLLSVGIVFLLACSALLFWYSAIFYGDTPRRTSQDPPIGLEVDHYER